MVKIIHVFFWAACVRGGQWQPKIRVICTPARWKSSAPTQRIIHAVWSAATIHVLNWAPTIVCCWLIIHTIWVIGHDNNNRRGSILYWERFSIEWSGGVAINVHNHFELTSKLDLQLYCTENMWWILVDKIFDWIGDGSVVRRISAKIEQ